MINLKDNLIDNALSTSSVFPFKATSVPRLVYKFCRAERETERIEAFDPNTSK